MFSSVDNVNLTRYGVEVTDKLEECVDYDKLSL